MKEIFPKMTAMSPLPAHRDPGLRLLMCTHIYQEKWKEPGKRKEKERKPKRLDTLVTCVQKTTG